MANLLSYLLGRKLQFYPFEIRMIEEVKNRLEGEGASLLQRQLDAINKIQRLAEGKEVNLYQMRFGRAAFDEKLRFPIADDEALLATVSLLDQHTRSKLKIEIWVVKGRLFSLVFNKSPKQFFAGLSLNSVQPEISDVKVWFNPMRASDTPVGAPTIVLTGWLEAWHAKGRVAGLCPPFPHARRSAFLDRIDAKLPPDYLELTEQTEGATLANCVVNGLSRIRTIVFAEANYIVLAEIETRGVLAVKDGSRDAELYLLDHESDEVRRMGTSFEKAVAALLKLDELRTDS